MKNKLLIACILGTMISGTVISNDAKAMCCKPNSIRVSCYELDPNNPYKFDNFWTPENEVFLTDDQREIIHSLRTKSQNGESLTLQEKNLLKSLKAEVIKKKLGDSKYEELQKLIDKRSGSESLTIDERARLYELDKEATGDIEK